VSLGVRWLLVVQRDQLDLFERLEQRFQDITFVRIVFDRRRVERRRQARRTGAEQRRRQRRQPSTAREQEQLFGYRLVYRGQPLSPTVPSLQR
jgi:hypothetical protein